MKLILILLGLLAISSIFLFHHKSQDEYEAYKVKYGKSYPNSIDEFRRAIFYENKAKIDAWNANPNKEHYEAVNQFTDLTQEEFEKQYLGLLPQPSNPSFDDGNATNDDDIDWTKKGEPFNVVKNQGACGSCWAFSAVAGMEGVNAVTFAGKKDQFSEQMLVDCSTSYGNHGCNGGLMTYAFKFVMDNGIKSESDYPYVARDQTCKFKTGPFKIGKYTEIKSCDDQVKKLQKQPISIACDASRWSSYSGGVFSSCGTRLNHGITLVGLNTQGEKYWKVKNSWGASWGESGFIRLKYPGSTCGCCDMSSYPENPSWN